MAKIKYMASERKRELGEAIAKAIRVAMAMNQTKQSEVRAFGCVQQRTYYKLKNPLSIKLGELFDIAEQFPDIEFANPLILKIK